MAAGVKGAGLAFKQGHDFRLLRLQPGLVDRLATALGLLTRHDVERGGGLLAAHHGRAGVGPRETKTRVKRAPTHAVVARTKRRAAVQRDVWHLRVAQRLDHLGAVLDHAGLFGGAAHDEAGGVLQKHDGCARLVAQVDELRRLGRARRVDGAVVADEGHRIAVDAGMAADGGAAVVWLEVQPGRIVHQSGNDFAHVDGLTLRQHHHAREIVGREAGWARRLGGRGHHGPGPVDGGQHLTGQGNRVRVVLRHVLGQAADGGVHVGAAQRLVGGDLARGGFEQRRPRQKGFGLTAHHDHVIRQAGHVGPACGGRAVHHREHRQAGR